MIQRLLLSLLILSLFQNVNAQATAPAAATKPTPTPSVVVDPTSKLISEAILQMNKNDLDGSLATINKAIQLDPKIPGSYVLRASIYYQKKQWDLAQADFTTASNLSPKNVVIKFNMVEIKFIQKKYDEARAGYLELQNDSDMGDLAKFKVFLCDVLGKHDQQAAQEFAAFNKAGENPSYYYSNFVWSMLHQNVPDARDWLASAERIYSPRKNNYYQSTLHDAGFLPLPPLPSPAP
ncbi:MAG: hypothetical protein LV479_11660 [Methylacidiphilales bacterium]|nr:hypothetical protein [Candidatus Methylacidiphilales bacterium]